MKNNYIYRKASVLLILAIMGFCSSSFANKLISAGVTAIAPGGQTAAYPNIQAAYNDIDFSALAGAYLIELNSNYNVANETLPINLTAKANASATNTITIRPANGVTLSITAESKIISFNGAKFVTIDGRAGGAGTTKGLTFENTSLAATASTIDFVNDAYKNTLKYCTVLGAQVIPTGGSTADPTMGTIVIGTTTGTEARAGDATNGFTGSGNLYNTIDNCNIGNASTGLPTSGVYMAGTATFTNEGNVVSNCNIYNYFNPGNNYSCAVFIAANAQSSVITNNKMYQESARTFGTWGIHTPIYIKAPTQEVSFNTIGYANNNATGTYTIGGAVSHKFQGMNLSGTVTILKGNTISDIEISSTSVGGANIGVAVGIFNAGNNFPTGAEANPNTIRNITLNATASPTSTFSLAGISTTSWTGGNVFYNVIDNLKVNFTGANASTIRGILYGIYAINSWGITAKNNRISNLRVGIAGNNGAHVVTAISATPQNNQGVIVEQNEIYNLNAISSAGAIVTGVFANSGTGASIIKNNLITLGNDVESPAEIRAIYKSNSGTLKAYHNSIYIGGTTTGAITFCLYRNAATPSVVGEEYVNNIFVNKRTGGPAGNHYAFGMANAADYNGGFIAFNNNLVLTDAASNLAFVGANIDNYAALGTTYPNFATGCVNVDPLFIAATSATPDLHVSSASPANMAGIEISTVTTDFAGAIRADYSPHDLGAFVIGSSTAVEKPNNTQQKVYAANKDIIFENMNGSLAIIYNISGQQMKQLLIVGDQVSLNITRGIYIVSVNNTKTKVLVK